MRPNTVFISYRRDDTAGEARALHNELVESLGEQSVFMDVDNIALGQDFRRALEERLKSCDLMLVLIGRNWASTKIDTARSRLQDDNDYVRLEISTALKRGISVTPVLVQGAPMPSTTQMPPDLADLSYRNGFEISHARWESDVKEMLRRLGLRPRSTTRFRPPRRLILLAGAVSILVGILGLLYFERDFRTPPGRLADRTAPSQQITSFFVTDYLGEWQNIDPNTRGITRVRVGRDGERISVQVWGRCHPTDCDWGVVTGTALAASVEASSSDAIMAITATSPSGFYEDRLSLRLVTRNELVVTGYDGMWVTA